MTHVQKQTAQLLKEKGFDLPCLAWYIVEDEIMRSTTDFEDDTNGRFPNAFTAPELYKVPIWLRTKGVHVYVTCTYSEWYYIIQDTTGVSLFNSTTPNKTHDLALEAGIVQALKNYVK